MLKHEDIKKYIIGDIDESLLNLISTLRDENFLFQVIFNLIDQVDTDKILSVSTISVDRKELQFSTIDILIEEIIAGSADSSKRSRFIQLLYHSPDFYIRLITKFNQIHPLLDNDEVKELNEINIKTDDDILDLIRKNIGNAYATDGLHLRVTENAEKKLKNIWTMPVVRRFVYAAAAVLLIVPSIYFLNYQYHTTYKNHIAQNLLEENYRIYISGQPRLSGGYQSTGISQLMSGDEDSLNYLNHAKEIINEVLKYDSNDKQALHLKAQVLIMQEQNHKADSLLNIALSQETTSPEMLNDLGVVYFAKKEWQKAKTFFKLCLKQDPNYTEAYYNLALTEINLSNIDDARSAIDSFLKLEIDPGWKNAGLNLLSTMEGD